MISTEAEENQYEARFNKDDKVCLKLRGIPFRVDDDTVYDFFAGYSYIENSLIIGVRSDGKRTGDAAILFHSEEDAQKAYEGKNNNSIGERWIDLFIQSFQWYEDYPKMGFAQKETSIAEILLEKGKRQRAIKLRGIPFSAEKSDIMKFMGDYPVEPENIHFEIRGGRFSGRAIVILDDEDTAINAADDLHKKYIGSRYIEVDACCNLDNIF